MDVTALKSSELSELDAPKAKKQKAKGGAATAAVITGLAQSFTEMVKAGFKIDRTGGGITDRFSFIKNDAADQPPAIRQDYPRSDAYDRPDDPGRDYPRADGYRDDSVKQPQNGNDERNVNATSRDNSNSAPGIADPGRDDAPDKSGEAAASTNSTNSSDKSKNGPGQASDKTSDKTSGGDSADTSSKNAAATSDAKTTQPNSSTVKSSAGKVLAGQIALAGNSSRSGRAAEQAGAKILNADGHENAVKGLTKALAAAPKQNRANTGADDHAGLKNQGRNGQANAKINTDTQSAIQAATDPAAKATDKKAKQAAGIAKAAGDGNKLTVQVAVENEANVLVSRPRSSLLTTAGSGSDNKSTSGRNNGRNGAQGPAQSGLAQAQNQAAQNGLKQAAKAPTASGPNLKAPARSALNAGAQAANGTGGAGGIGGENLPGGATQTNHSGQAGEAKSATGGASLPPRTIIKQVTVQITKALSAGVDKINIQLRPETLGRVEVQLEMAKDGKTVAVVTADNKDTLNLLKQDSQNLQQALQDAGLDLDSGDLSFNLRGEGTGGEGSNGEAGGHEIAEGNNTGGETADTSHAGLYNDIIEKDRIDVRA